jgi:hypothetical protein
MLTVLPASTVPKEPQLLALLIVQSVSTAPQLPQDLYHALPAHINLHKIKMMPQIVFNACKLSTVPKLH